MMAKNKRVDPLIGVDLLAEYSLIQEKKSKLSARLRERVCILIEIWLNNQEMNYENGGA